MITAETSHKKTISNFTDEEIINEVKLGNHEYYSEIVKRYNQRLYRIAISFGIYNDDCDEVIQLAYIAAFEKIDQFRAEAKFSTWLIRILINECLMLKRKNKRFIALTENDIVTIPSGDHQNPEETFMNKEKKEILEKAITQLPEKYKSVYMFKEVEGMSIEEVSDALEISKVNVKVRLHRAKSMLRDTIRNITDVSNLFTFGNERCDRINNSVMDYIRKEKNIA